MGTEKLILCFNKQNINCIVNVNMKQNCVGRCFLDSVSNVYVFNLEKNEPLNLSVVS